MFKTKYLNKHCNNVTKIYPMQQMKLLLNLFYFILPLQLFVLFAYNKVAVTKSGTE